MRTSKDSTKFNNKIRNRKNGKMRIMIESVVIRRQWMNMTIDTYIINKKSSLGLQSRPHGNTQMYNIRGGA